MPTEDTSTSLSGLEVTKLLPELEVPFSPDQVGGGLLLGAPCCGSKATREWNWLTTSAHGGQTLPVGLGGGWRCCLFWFCRCCCWACC